MVQTVSLGKDGFSYSYKGDSPRLLIHAGTHGDEHEVIALVTESIKKYQVYLPAFIYVPRVSPSAVVGKTRHNKRGKDINRIFLETAGDEEVLWNMEVMRKGPFELVVSFHEDPVCKDYYIYDTNAVRRDSGLVLNHNRWLKEQGIGLLNGLDDPGDPDLGYRFRNGYRKFSRDMNGPDNGMITVWGHNRSLITHSMIVEVPGLLGMDSKRKIVDSFFGQVLVEYF